MPSVLEQPTPTQPKRRAQRKQISPQQMRYAEYRGQGLTQGEAALKAGYKSKAGSYKADRNPQVIKYLSEIQRNAAVRTGYVVASAMDEAKDAMTFAYKTENASAYVKAVELRAKLSGLLIERVEVFTADLKGALAQAQSRIINVTASIQSAQASLQAQSEQAVETPRAEQTNSETPLPER